MALRYRIFLLALTFCFTATAGAETFPTRNIRLVVPFAPGGTSDFIARVVAKRMSELGGQLVYVENKTGATGTVAMWDVARATPDGYTLILADTTMGIVPSFMPKAGIDPMKMFQPVALVATVPSLLVIHPSVPATTVAELTAYAKANPGKLNFASGGIGTGPHLQGEMFKSMAGLDIAHVPYRGAGAALQDVVGGRVELLFTGGPTALPLVESGQLRAIATTGATRYAALPSVPTMVESGFKDFVSLFWFGIATTAGTPEPVVRRLNELVVAAARDPAVATRIVEQGGTIQAGSPADFGRFIEDEIARWGQVIAAAGITAP
jgi:tripartite-type tricarboxylate transporter receptor subunit TctC